ncbi:hypothetical protein T492DRAFT_846990 [Pavlovales sp. CCMP2436]|nr:hypothetical protein T492DRAFT_846990 [Pavlovales sp. CCMP2436]
MVIDHGGIITVPTVDFVQTSTSVAAGSNYVSMPIADFGSVGKILRKDLPAFLRASYAPLFTAGMEMGIFGPRHQRSKILMEKVQAKYGAAHVIGHSLGGHLAEHSGARGIILTVDKAVGVRDLGAQSNPNELDIRAKGDPISALSHGGLREEVVPARNPTAAPHLLPGPIRAPLGMIIRGLYAHDYRHI